MCSDSEEIHLDVMLQEIHSIKKGRTHAFYELGVIVSSICHDNLDNV